MVTCYFSWKVLLLQNSNNTLDKFPDKKLCRNLLPAQYEQHILSDQHQSPSLGDRGHLSRDRHSHHWRCWASEGRTPLSISTRWIQPLGTILCITSRVQTPVVCGTGLPIQPPLLFLLSAAQGNVVTLLSLQVPGASEAGAYFIHLPFAVSSHVI